MNRRNFIRTTGISLASALLTDVLIGNSRKESFMSFPDEVTAVLDNHPVKMTLNGKNTWTHKDLRVDLKNSDDGIVIEIAAAQSSLIAVALHWTKIDRLFFNVLNDHWERSYGDVSWHEPRELEILPWYFMEHNNNDTYGYGTKTGAASFCSWQVGNNGVSFTMDTRSGGNGVQLGGRTLIAAEIVTTKSRPDESPFETTRRFVKKMCDKARLPQQPVYGINDWYFTYGNNSAQLILRHTEMVAPMAEGLENRPFSVIDAGWFVSPPSSPNDCCWGDRMDVPNAKFGDMSKVAENIRKVGMRPGIWTRPLCGSYQDPQSLMLPVIKGREEKKPVLDPTIPENLERIRNYFKLYDSWGYDLVKFDFTTFDILGKWGFEMLRDGTMTSSDWKMCDNSKTNAEIILSLYRTIRESAGKTYVIGCNTISHLSAGLFELNRIGDDTSGLEWDRTRKMGVNALAFRGLQHGVFYAADPDCVGLTTKVDWNKNKQWMELVAKSGVPLFVSAQAEAMGSAQKAAIKECFRLASQEVPLGEPLDWMQTPTPKRWKLIGDVVNFDWD